VDIQISGILGLLILVADIWAIINIAQARVDNIKKLLWILLIIFLPLLGVIIWWLAGPRGPGTA
jgi:hypothetical protein